ncbi:MAG: YqeG family HAD IIIA-type phosphatase [Ignavibacteriales bacterium]|nr:YqeG family HAD IIIA-type phosphatase [Ignavibacteriales bacterium]
MSSSLFNIDFFRNINLIFKPSLWVPDFEVNSIFELREVIDSTIKGIVFDIDQTLIPYGQTIIDKHILEEIDKLKQNYSCCLLSNYPKMISRTNRLNNIENQLGIPVVLAEKKKPDPVAFRASIEKLKLMPGQIAMVGDRILTDIIGAKNCGFKTVLVKPLDAKTDPYVMVTLPRKIEITILTIIKYLTKANIL